MPRNHPQSALSRKIALALVAALSFLFVASYLAVPCMTRDASQFQNVGAPNSCTEHHLFRPQADLPKLFQSLASESPFRLPAILAPSVMSFLVLLLLKPAAHDRLRRRRRRNAARLPFATADPPRLPYFAALRDA